MKCACCIVLFACVWVHFPADDCERRNYFSARCAVGFGASARASSRIENARAAPLPFDLRRGIGPDEAALIATYQDNFRADLEAVTTELAGAEKS